MSMTDGFLYLNTYYTAKIRKKTKHPTFSTENFKFPSKNSLQCHFATNYHYFQ